MPTITLKNIPEELYAHLKQSAALNHRSINSEIIVCLERALCFRSVPLESVLARARHVRESTREHPITDAEFAEAKAAGRR